MTPVVGSKWYNIFTRDVATIIKCDNTYVTYTKNNHRYTKPINVFIKTHKQSWHTQ